MSPRKKSDHHPANPAQTMQELVDAKHERAQQVPSWPGAREQAEPQHALTPPAAPEATPAEPGNGTTPSRSGYERSGDVGKRHH